MTVLDARMKFADRAVARILSMSDEQIMAETTNDDLTAIDETKAMIDKLIKQKRQG